MNARPEPSPAPGETGAPARAAGQDRRPRRRERLQRTFSALRVRNFRVYFIGLAVSLVGTWMQVVAQAWLVMELSGHSGTMVGLVLGAQFLPVLLLGPYAGLIVDRVPTRALLAVTQSVLALLALALGLLTLSGTVRLWMVFAVAAVMGVATSVDSPARQTFVPELVGPRVLPNAVSLNSITTNASRAIGPAAGGVIIALAGNGVCFLVNAGSFLAVLGALAFIRPAALHRVPPVPRERHQVRRGLRYIRHTTGLLTPLIMMALVGTLAYEFTVVLPLLAHLTLHGTAATYGLLAAAMGAGAVLGGVILATVPATGLRRLIVSCTAFGMAILAAALVPTVHAEIAALILVGAGSTAFLASGNTLLQLTSDPHFRGRVMALWSVMYLGSTPVGGPLIGVVAEHFSPRYALGVGGAACLAAAAIGLAGLRKLPPAERRAARQHAVCSLPGRPGGRSVPCSCGRPGLRRHRSGNITDGYTI